MSGVSPVTLVTDPETRALFASEFGIGPTGPNRLSSLTRSEKKVYLEGLKRLRESENEQATGDSRPKGQPRESDREMVRNMEREMQAS